MALPDRCVVKEGGGRCASPPEFIVSVAVGADQYMIGVACSRHRDGVSRRIGELQRGGGIPGGRICFERVRAVGTDCLKGDACGGDGVRDGDLVQIG